MSQYMVELNIHVMNEWVNKWMGRKYEGMHTSVSKMLSTCNDTLIYQYHKYLNSKIVYNLKN